jgi:hypothetical protein
MGGHEVLPIMAVLLNQGSEPGSFGWLHTLRQGLGTPLEKQTPTLKRSHLQELRWSHR